MKRFLITGADSFIGRAIVRRVLDRGDRVIAVVMRGVEFCPISQISSSDSPNELTFASSNLPRPARNLPKIPSEKSTAIRIVHANMDEYANLADMVGEKNIDVCIHLAWDGARDGRNDPVRQAKNVEASIQLFEGVVKLNCDVFVGAGTQMEYGSLYEKINEEAECKPTTEYGRAKFEFTKYLLENAPKHGIRPIMPRIFSIIGEEDRVSIFASVLDKMLVNEDIDLTEATQLWNFIYVEDYVSGLLQLIDKGGSGIYNFASLDTRPLRKFFEVAKKIVGSTSVLKFGAVAYPSTGKVSIDPDISKLVQFGYEGFTPFEEAVKKIVKRRREG